MARFGTGAPPVSGRLHRASACKHRVSSRAEWIDVTLLRSERVAALLLVLAAALGVGLANSPLGAAVFLVRDTHLDIPVLGIELSIGHWITEGLLAIFFFLAAIELRHELTHGELDSPRKALIPAVAAVGGVLAPVLVYLALVRD